MQKPTLRRIDQLSNAKFLNMYQIEYSIDDANGNPVKDGKWLMVSRKKLPALTQSFEQPRADAVVVMAFVEEKLPESHSGSGQFELKLLVTKEYRHPIQNFEYGFVAGLIDGQESAVAAARRELKEESGLDMEKVLLVSPPIVSSAGLSDESVQIVFCTATGKLSTADNEPHEIIEPMLLDYENVSLLCERRGPFKDVVISAKVWPSLLMLRQMGMSMFLCTFNNEFTCE